jgi:hypothetical protein
MLSAGTYRTVKKGLSNSSLARFLGCAALGLVFCVASTARAQMAPAAAPASAVATPNAGVSTGEAKTPPPNIATPAPPSASPHLIAKPGPPVDEVNRKALEDSAGKDASSVLLRSSPPGAQIYINGDFVGYAPLLLNVAPGKYKVEMRDQHNDSAERTVGLLAKDTQKVTLMLSSRYPNRVSMH